MSSVGDVYHNCRWCNHFKDGFCTNSKFLGYGYYEEQGIYQVAESGKLSELLQELLPHFEDDKITELDERISVLYQEYAEDIVKGSGVYISDPEDFYCKEFE